MNENKKLKYKYIDPEKIISLSLEDILDQIYIENNEEKEILKQNIEKFDSSEKEIIKQDLIKFNESLYKDYLKFLENENNILNNGIFDLTQAYIKGKLDIEKYEKESEKNSIENNFSFI